MRLIFTFFLSAFSFVSVAATDVIKHHSCELWVPLWQIHATGSPAQRSELKGILKTKNYKKINFTVRGPGHDADHLILTFDGTYSAEPGYPGVASLDFNIHDYSTNNDNIVKSQVGCEYEWEHHEGHVFETACTARMIEAAKMLPSCRITH